MVDFDICCDDCEIGVLVMYGGYVERGVGVIGVYLVGGFVE